MANRFELAVRAWPILTKAAADGEIITYEELATRLGYAKAATTMRNALWPLQDLCIVKRPPPLTSIVVSKAKRRPGDGFVQRDDEIADSWKRVRDNNWSERPPPTISELILASAAPGGAPGGHRRVDSQRRQVGAEEDA